MRLTTIFTSTDIEGGPFRSYRTVDRKRLIGRWSLGNVRADLAPAVALNMA